MNEQRQELSQQRAIHARCLPSTEKWPAFPRTATEQAIAARFEQIAACYPSQPALQMGSVMLTYEQLNQAANRVAHTLIARFGVAEEPVALLLRHRIHFVVGVLGVLKAGKICVPLDPSHPPARLQMILQEATIRIGLTDQVMQERWTEAFFAEKSEHEIDFVAMDAADLTDSTANPGLQIGPAQLAWIYYTSGSTGHPKGVIQSQRNILHEIRRATTAFAISAADRLSFTLPGNVSGGMREVLLALLNGATLYPFDLNANSLRVFAAWLAQTEITVCRFMPTVFRHFAAELQQEIALPQMRLIYLGGELVSKRDVELFCQSFPPACRFVQAFGASETGIICFYFITKTTQITGERVPLGYAVEDVDIVVCDDAGRAVGANEIGEIVVQSRYLAQGYWRAPQLTQAAFSSTPGDPAQRLYRTGDLGLMHADGCLEYHGRKDNQVKIRGYRIEISEIEATLLSVAAIKAAVVVTREDTSGELTLCAYLVLHQGHTATQAELRQQLHQRLPEYMIPADFVLLPQLPLLSNGKVDRRGLSAPKRKPPAVGKPAVDSPTAVEQLITEIWREVLARDQVSTNVQFRDLGGHSLHAMRIATQIHNAFGVEIPLVELFAAPTVAEMALTVLTHVTAAKELQAPVRLNLGQMALSKAQVAAIQALNQELSNPAAPQDWLKLAHRGRWHRRRHVMSALLCVLPYPLVYRLLTLLCHSSWWLGRFYTKQLALTQQFLAVIGSPQTGAEVIARSILYNWLHYYEIHPARDSALPAIAGLDLLAAIRRQGRGVILVQYHDTTSLRLNLPGAEPVVAVGGVQNYLAYFNIQNELVLNALFAQQLTIARQVLQKGGIVRIRPDGHHGLHAGLVLDFHGRRRPFFTSFAELALMTDAAVIAMVGDMDQQGYTHLTLVGPLDAGHDRLPHTQRVERLVAQYVERLSRLWTETPWLVPWYQMERHLAYPPSQESSQNQK